MKALARARAAWGASLPEWVKFLAEACDETSLRKVAGKLDVSPASVSLAISGKRKNLEFIRCKVEVELMITIVACPVLGVLDVNTCLREQARSFISTNPLRVQLYRACRNGCPHFKSKEKTQ